MKKMILIAFCLSSYSLEVLAASTRQIYDCVATDRSREEAVLDVTFNPNGAEGMDILLFSSKSVGACESYIETSGGLLQDLDFYRYSHGGYCNYKAIGVAEITWAGKLIGKKSKKVTITYSGYPGGQRSFNCTQ